MLYRNCMLDMRLFQLVIFEIVTQAGGAQACDCKRDRSWIGFSENKSSASRYLYPAHSRIGRGNLVLRHTVSHFPLSSGGIAWWVAELNAALCLDTRAKKWKYKCKETFHFFEWGPNPQLVDFTVTLCANMPRLASMALIRRINNKDIFDIFKVLFHTLKGSKRRGITSRYLNFFIRLPNK